MVMEGLESSGIWRDAAEIVKAVYELTATALPPEVFGMASPVRRVAEDALANLSEAVRAANPSDAVRFTRAAREALYEVDTLLSMGTRSEAEQPADVLELRQRLADLADRLSNYIGDEEFEDDPGNPAPGANGRASDGPDAMAEDR